MNHEAAGRARQLTLAGATAYEKYWQGGDPAMLDAAVDAFSQALAAVTRDDPDRCVYQANLRTALRCRAELTWNPSDLDGAIAAGLQAAGSAPPGHPARPGYLHDAGALLIWRYQRDRNPADIDAAVEALISAVEAAPAEDPGLARRLSDLSGALLERFEGQRAAADLDAATEHARRAVAIAAPEERERAGMLSNLANCLRDRYQRDGELADLEAAVGLGREAVAATPPQSPHYAGHLANLASSLSLWYRSTRQLTDIDAAITIGREAAAAAPPGHPIRPGVLLNLAVSLDDRFERTGAPDDLDEAIEAIQRSASVTPASHPWYAECHSRLAVRLSVRFRYSADPADIDAAIEAGRRAVAATPADQQRLHAGYLANLGGYLLRRFEWSKEHADISASIETTSQAITATAGDDASLAMRLSNLSGQLVTRYRWAGYIGDLNGAIRAARESVAAAPAGHPDRIQCLANLALTLGDWHERTGELTDLDEAIAAACQAVAEAPPGHPDAEIAAHALVAGSLLIRRFQQTGEEQDRAAAIRHWERASQLPAATPAHRLRAAWMWGAAAGDGGAMASAAAGYATGVGLLPVVAWHGLSRAVRAGELSRSGGVVMDAAACSILNGQPDHAVELLEQGRSVLWSQALSLRGDLSLLAARAPELFARLDSARKVLDAAPDDPALAELDAADGGPPAGRADRQRAAAESRRNAAREWDRAVVEVRALGGDFTHFLGATPYAELTAAAADGPVVLVNVSRHGCHALIVRTGTEHAEVIDLPGLTQQEADRNATRLLAVTARVGEGGQADAGEGADDGQDEGEGEDDTDTVLDLLDWLWETVAEPVLTALGHTGPPGPPGPSGPPGAGAPWPRLWWCPTGALTFLPLHAAGKRPRAGEPASGDCVPDRVMSSYTPTLSTLARARQGRGAGVFRHLSVGMPHTPGQPALPAILAELAMIAGHFPPGKGHQQLTGDRATRADVTAALDRHSWVHLACHAIQEPTDPDRSGFGLWDGTLTVADLAGRPTQDRDLAYLSACTTAAGGIRYIDEAIHLASAMQFLGYRHVVATMWAIGDWHAQEVADAVYSTLLRDGTADPRQAARAVHEAAGVLRRSYPGHPLVWAPYIHLGP